MVVESDPTQSETAGGLLTEPAAKSHRPSVFKWGSSSTIKEGSDCDVQTLAATLAARRKRAEIRRFKLMAAAHEGFGVEPLPKRSKTISYAVHDPSGEGLPTLMKLQGCQPHDEATARANYAGSILGAGKSVAGVAGNEITDAGTSQKLDESKDDEESSDSRSRLAASPSITTCSAHCVVSICGRTRLMEDAAIAVPSFLLMPSSAMRQGDTAQADTYHFYGVYDGHGGAQAAEICKERLHGVLAEEMSLAAGSSPSHWEACIQSSFKKLDDELCGVCPHGSGCPCKAVDTGSSSCREPLVHGSVGTTAVVAVVGASHIVVGNCGDSRAVLCRGGEAVPLSVDHKANRPDEIARIEAAGGQVFSWQGYRVCGVLAMSRALGDGFLKPFVSGEPEVTSTERSGDDECLILASDGLWDVLSNKYVCTVARKAMANWRVKHANFQRRYSLFAHRNSEDEQGFQHTLVMSSVKKAGIGSKSIDQYQLDPAGFCPGAFVLSLLLSINLMCACGYVHVLVCTNALVIIHLLIINLCKLDCVCV